VLFANHRVLTILPVQDGMTFGVKINQSTQYHFAASRHTKFISKAEQMHSRYLFLDSVTANRYSSRIWINLQRKQRIRV
jgi:hypothetical protein